MKQTNVGFYAQTINKVVEITEQTGEAMNPFFETVRQAIDNGTVSELTETQYKEIKEAFGTGLDNYKKLSTMLTGQKAPIKVVGIHKKFEKTYADYITSCQAMIDSLGDTPADLDVEKFNHSEEQQDDVTETLAFCVQRLSNLLLK
ncbi:hypothetical protein [Vagococcus xieshaowenii]|uniref:Uncharacterized protein n=1 Tax=Vagococcus xieshaowenii TaxID=2562451 RepID=A0AAJ5EEM4_9ENTE|nr:hypothetical protein [Vagococcus xieshaowenii]QCA27895.1 hypothetical protein E4Z98_00440 [Vagococcus xieshaowenii]TFZ39426.1 hypothetical protein E4031_08950 [Vagococcus xieshaowenii]